ncbi:DUF6624 domain-containing protein [Emticicia fontis]
MIRTLILSILSWFIFYNTTFAQKVILDPCICKQKILADSLYLSQLYASALPVYVDLIRNTRINSFKQEFRLKKGHCELAKGNFRKGYNSLKWAFNKPIYVPGNYSIDSDPSLQNYLKSNKKIQKIRDLYEKNKKLLLGINAVLSYKILELKREDQKYRKPPHESDSLAKSFHISLDSLNALQDHIDFENRKKLNTLLGEINNKWPGIESVGTDGLNGIWLIVQHADKDLSFQKKCLEAMGKGLVEDSGIWLHYAYLFDRVAVNQNTEQGFSTQFDDVVKDENGRYIDIVFKKNLKEVDVYRQCIGLPSVKEYKAIVLKRWNK